MPQILVIPLNSLLGIYPRYGLWFLAFKNIIRTSLIFVFKTWVLDLCCFPSQRQEPCLSLWAGVHSWWWHTDFPFLHISLCTEFYQGGKKNKICLTQQKPYLLTQQETPENVLSKIRTKEPMKEDSRTKKIRLFSQDKGPIKRNS